MSDNDEIKDSEISKSEIKDSEISESEIKDSEISESDINNSEIEDVNESELTDAESNVETDDAENKTEPEKKTILPKKVKTLRIILMTIIFLCAALLIGMYIRDHSDSKSEKAMHEAVKTEEQIKKAPKSDNTNPVDFDTLHKQNADIFAWIRIPNSKVDYAICQSTKDKGEDYYLNHGYSQEKAELGAIYIQMRNKKDFSDPDTVVYGHNAPASGKMFRSIHNYEDADFFKKNPEFTIYTEDNRKLTYHVFAAYNYDDRLILDYFNDFKNPSLFSEYLKEIEKSGSKMNYDSDNAATKDDKIITLSTCNGVSDQRFLVQAKLVSDKKMDPYKK